MMLRIETQKMLLKAAREVYKGLNARIKAAPDTAVPVFRGLADLHDALGEARKDLSPKRFERMRQGQ